MGKFVLTDAVVLLDGRDLSGNLNSVSLDISVETPEKTVFGDTGRTRLPGIMDITADHSGYWEIVSALDDLDADLIARVGASSALMSLSDDGGALGDYAYSFLTQTANYVRGASHGEVYAFSITVNTDGPLVRGVLMENKAFAGTENGTDRQIGAVTATQSIYSSIHVTAVSGTDPTLDVTVESDASTAFSGAETVRMTHPQMVAVGSNQQILAGAITDDWWRYVMTIGGTVTPTFTVFGALAIQTTLQP